MTTTPACGQAWASAADRHGTLAQFVVVRVTCRCVELMRDDGSTYRVTRRQLVDDFVPLRPAKPGPALQAGGLAAARSARGPGDAGPVATAAGRACSGPEAHAAPRGVGSFPRSDVWYTGHGAPGLARSAGDIRP